MNLYADTNFLAGHYLDIAMESPAPGMMQRAQENGWLPLPVTWLLRVELLNAIEQLVFAARTTGQARVSPELAAAAQANFRDDLRAGAVLRHRVVALDDLVAQFETLALRHTARHGFRTYDLLHVSAALVLGCDTRARRLAKLEGLRVN